MKRPALGLSTMLVPGIFSVGGLAKNDKHKSHRGNVDSGEDSGLPANSNGKG